MTLVLKLDLDVVNMYHQTKSEVSRSGHSIVTACTDRQTDRHTERQYENITLPVHAGGNYVSWFASMKNPQLEPRKYQAPKSHINKTKQKAVSRCSSYCVLALYFFLQQEQH